MTLLNVHGSFGSSGTVSILPKGLKPSSAYYSGAGKVHDQTGAVTVRQQEGITTTFRLQERDVFDFAMDHEWDKVRQLLARDGATVIKSRNRNGATLLIALSENDYAGANAEIIGLLLASGADINAQAKDGTTALHNAAKGHRVDYLGFLLSKGADPRLVIHDSYYPTTNGFTPLHFLLSAYDLNRTPASSAQKIQAIKLLLKHGADVNAKDAKGDSPLHHAAVFGDPEIVSALLRAGADRSARNSANETALTSIRRLDDTPAVHRIRDMLAGK
jgi:ankyrin repeat protein